MRRKPPVLMLTATIVGALAVGCGSDNGGGDADASDSPPEAITTSSLTKAAYVKKANALCTRNRNDAAAKFNSYIKKNPGKSQEELLPKLVKDIYVPGQEEKLADLRELGAPAGDEKQVEAIIVAFEKAVDSMSRLKGSTSSPKIDKQLGHAGRLARKYNLIECTYG